MLFIIGGAPRSGKSIISRRFTREAGVPSFSIDFLITALEQAPEYHIKHGQPFIIKAEKLWRFIKPLSIHLIQETESYLLEGDGILPKHVAELVHEYPNQMRAAFLGIAEADTRKKLQLIREWEHLPDAGWTKQHSDEGLSAIIENIKRFSMYLKHECAKYELPYIEFPNSLDDLYVNVRKLFL